MEQDAGPAREIQSRFASFDSSTGLVSICSSGAVSAAIGDVAVSFISTGRVGGGWLVRSMIACSRSLTVLRLGAATRHVRLRFLRQLPMQQHLELVAAGLEYGIRPCAGFLPRPA
jgi:hypothetical protein